MTYNAPPAEMKRVGYSSMEVPAEKGQSLAAMPALFIRMRPLGVDPAYAGGRTDQPKALLDTGASVSSVPMWSLDQMGIAPDKGSRQEVFGPSSGFHAYDVKIGAEVEHNEGWLDIGAMSASCPTRSGPAILGFTSRSYSAGGAFSTSSTCASASHKRRCGSEESADGRSPARRRDDAGCAGLRFAHAPEAGRIAGARDGPRPCPGLAGACRLGRAAWRRGRFP